MKDIICEVCDRSFKSASGLASHRRLVHRSTIGKRGGSPKAQPDLDELVKRLRAVESELDDWRSGRIVFPFNPELHTRDEESAARLEEYVKARVQNLSEIEVKELARKYKLWPPPDPGRKLRAFMPTGGL